MFAQVRSLVLVVCLTVAMNWTASAQGAPGKFEDDFSDGSATDGNPVTWIAGPNLGSPISVAVVNQDYRLSGGGGTSLVADSEAFTDVSIHTVVRATVETIGNPAFHFLGPIARDNGVGSFYWGGITTDRHLSVGNWNPFDQSAAVSVPLLDPTLGDIDLQFDVVGQTLSLWAWSDALGIAKPTSPQIVWNSGLNRAHGSIGVSYNANGGQGWVDYRSVAVVDPTPELGDTDADGDVDLDDLNSVRNHFGEAGVAVPGDTAPFDGDVDLDDLNSVRNYFGVGGMAAVPEPHGIVLAAMSALCCGLFVRVRHCRAR